MTSRNLRLGKRMDRYLALGLGLALFGAPFAIFSFIILLSIPLTAIGLACVILGAAIALVPESPVPKETIRAMIEGSCAGTESLLEEFNLKNRAVYLPPRDGRVTAYVSSDADQTSSWKALETPTRVIGEVGGNLALTLFPPGTEIIRLSDIGEESGVDEALSYVLVDFLEAVESVKSVEAGRRIIVSMSKPRIRSDFPRFNTCLGTLPTSIAGCVLAQVLNKPVGLIEEQATNQQVTTTFEVPRSPGET
jgi:hypothetical protein